MNPILSVECDEVKSVVTRNVYPMKLTRENLLKFWEKARKYPTLFTKEIKGDFDKFLDVFIGEEDGVIVSRGLLWVVDDFVGVFYATDIKPEQDALVHFTFFDGRVKGRAPLAQAMLRYVFYHYQFRRLTAHVPLFVVPAAVNFVQQVGFKKEGRKRKSSYYNGEWYDTIHFGILREEVENGS
jgi:RimJ/RimL family protein N-acetyltransferase